MGVVAAFWAWTLITRPQHFVIADDRVLAWAGFLIRNPDVQLAANIAGVAFVIALGAVVLHVLGALAYRASGATPLVSSVVVALAAMTIVPAGTAYVVGTLDFADARMTVWPPLLLASAAVLAIAGVMSWRIALAERRREALERILLGGNRREYALVNTKNSSSARLDPRA